AARKKLKKCFCPLKSFKELYGGVFLEGRACRAGSARPCLPSIQLARRVMQGAARKGMGGAGGMNPSCILELVCLRKREGQDPPAFWFACPVCLPPRTETSPPCANTPHVVRLA